MTKKKLMAARLKICLPVPMKEWLSKLAKETQISEAEHIRRAINIYRNQIPSLHIFKEKNHND